MELDLRPERRALVERVRELARERLAPRAAHYDATATFPAEDFADLARQGLLAPTVPREHGGLGLGPLCGDAFTLWMMTKELAKADLSLARCFEGHANSLLLLDAVAAPAQKARWFPGVVERGETWVVWSGEPQARAPGEASRFGTTLERADGGWVVDGSKVFATSAGGATWAILLVNTAGPRGEAQLAGSRVRHVVGHLAEETVHQAIRACGARSLLRPSPLERILRDLTFYIRHDNDDQVLATIGRAALGLPFDASFYKP